jgi:hypothetical protein
LQDKEAFEVPFDEFFLGVPMVIHSPRSKKQAFKFFPACFPDYLSKHLLSVSGAMLNSGIEQV